ncbi:MAG: DUF3786 domain-containing protein [Nitrospirota bacterium]
MIEIYKKLPGTNCGKCGLSTCMAFAQKVKTGGAQLTDCPFIDEDITEEQTSGSGSFSDYEQVSNELEKEATAVNFRETAEIIGGGYETLDGRDTIRLRMINRVYELRKEGLFENDKYCPDPWTKIIIYDYVRRKGSSQLTGDWLTLGHFPNTASHVKAFQSNAEKKIAGTFGNDLDELKKRCAEMGGVEGEGKAKADYFCSFYLLPHVPLYLSFYTADEEFDAECKILFDSGAEDYIDIEYLAYLVERFIEAIVSA